MEEMKLVVQGLPFESTQEGVAQFLGIQTEQLKMPIWSNSGRSKGIGFISCEDADIQRLKGFDGKEIEFDGNNRTLTIVEYDHTRKGNGPKKTRRNKQPPQKERGDQVPTEQVFAADENTSREVFVSNCSFDATEEDFRNQFSQYGEISEITIPTQFKTGRPKGFAFVLFATEEAREAALDADCSTMLGRQIGVRANKGRIERAGRIPKPRPAGLSEKPDGCRTIYVGNLPYSLDEDQLQQLFADCGQANARVVRQSWSKRSRGFGYVEFENEAAVDQAVQKDISIDGRELRLDYAKNRSLE